MSLFAISSIIVFFASIGFALFIYSDDTTSKLNRSWLRLSAAIALWSLGLFGVTTATNETTAHLWQYVLDISAIFIPVLIVYFILTFLGRKQYWLRYALFGIAVVLVILNFTTLFKLGVANDPSLGFFWIVPGPLYLVFPLFFLTGAFIAGGYLLYAYPRTKDPILRGQIKYQFLAAVFGVSGGITNFFPQLFDIYPFGNYFIVLYLFFMSYAVLRYRLLDTKVVTTQFFAGALMLVLLLNVLQASTVRDWLLQFLVFALALILSYMLVRSVRREVETRRELERLAQKLQKANDRLRELDRQKSEFLSIATHQLRGPLAAVRGHLSLVIDGTYGDVPERARNVVKRVFQSSGLMAQTINDFLNVSRIEQGSMQYEKKDFACDTLVKSIVEEIRPTAKEKKLVLELHNTCEGNCVVHADYGKLRHVFFNLIDNSIKYTQKGKVEVFVSHESQGDIIRFTVKDTGIGISKKEIGALFEKFVRARNATGVNINGTGLGLYVAREMVEAHRGKIWAESEGKGHGSTFIVELPAA